MIKKTRLVLFFLIAFGIFLRLFKLTELFYFSMDEAYVAFRGWGLFALNRPFLIGAAGPIQFHLPPYYFYLSAFLLAPFKGNPAGWGFWSALIGGATIYLLYKLVRSALNRETAIIASLLYATSFTAVFFDRHYWPLNLNPLYAVSTLFLLLNLNRKSIYSYLILALILVLAVSSDPSNLVLIMLSLAYLYKSRSKLKPKFIKAFSLTGLLVFFAPLIAFDLRHNWQNLFSISRFFEKTSVNQFQFQNLINSVLLIPQSLVRFWHSPQTNILELHAYCISFAKARVQNLSVFLVILSTLILILFLKKNIKSKNGLLQISSLSLGFYLLGITIFAGLGYPIFDHYLSGLLPVFALITALAIKSLPKLFKVLILVLFIFFNLGQISRANNPYGLASKQQLVSWAIQNLQGQDYALQSISKCHRENGLRYLFELTRNPPKQSFMDPNFSWLYRQPPSQIKPNKTLLVTDKPLDKDAIIVNHETFGALDAYILEN